MVTDLVWIPYQCSRARAAGAWTQWLAGKRLLFQGDSQTRTLFSTWLHHACGVNVTFDELPELLGDTRTFRGAMTGCLVNAVVAASGVEPVSMNGLVPSWGDSSPCASAAALCFNHDKVGEWLPDGSARSDVLRKFGEPLVDFKPLVCVSLCRCVGVSLCRCVVVSLCRCVVC